MKSFNVLIKTIALFLYGLITVVTCAAVWDSKPKVFISVVAALLLALNGYVIFRKAKAMEKEIKENGGIK